MGGAKPVKSNKWVGLMASVTVILSSANAVTAALVTFGPQPIVERINVAIIQVANDGGANDAPLWGTAGEQANVFALVDQIWAQAGIDVNFIDWRIESPPNSSTGTYNSTFALTGTPGDNNPRPTGDLSTIVSQAASAGVLHPDTNTLNLFVTRIVPGFSQTSDNTSNGLAFLGGNGITYWGGPNLPGFSGGQEVLASVLAHEIGHNLGLGHIVEVENLMQAGGSPNQGERLNSGQIATALASPFSVAVPESAHAVAAVFLVSLVGAVVMRRVKS